MSDVAYPKVRKVVMWLCDACIDGTGDQCHTPGCALIRNRPPDLSIRDNCFVESIDGAEIDYETLKRKAIEEERALGIYAPDGEEDVDLQPFDFEPTP